MAVPCQLLRLLSLHEERPCLFVHGSWPQAYGKTTYLVTTFELVPRGTEGAVSLEGTLAGVAAAAVFATLAYALGQVGGRQHWARLEACGIGDEAGLPMAMPAQRSVATFC